jgi:transposase-like protein
MKHYSIERKQAVIAKMMPPHNISVSALSDETGISQQTLYSWRNKAKEEGQVVPGDGKNPEKWSSEDKFAVVTETLAMNTAELSEYCRKKGLYPEQIADWKASCMQANATAQEIAKANREQSKQDKKKIKKLESELRRKEKALAETAALLVLQKKAQALWGESEDD